MELQIGQAITLSHNGSKILGSELISYSQVRVEAIGTDWVVVRNDMGDAYAGTFRLSDNKYEKLTS